MKKRKNKKKSKATKRMSVSVQMALPANLARLLILGMLDKRPLVNPMKDTRRIKILVKRNGKAHPKLREWFRYLITERPTRVKDVWKAMLRDGDYTDAKARKNWLTFYSQDLVVLSEYKLLRIREVA